MLSQIGTGTARGGAVFAAPGRPVAAAVEGRLQRPRCCRAVCGRAAAGRSLRHRRRDDGFRRRSTFYQVWNGCAHSAASAARGQAMPCGERTGLHGRWLEPTLSTERASRRESRCPAGRGSHFGACLATQSSLRRASRRAAGSAPRAGSGPGGAQLLQLRVEPVGAGDRRVAAAAHEIGLAADAAARRG